MNPLKAKFPFIRRFDFWRMCGAALPAAFVALGLICPVAFAAGPASPRECASLDAGWRFIKGDPDDVTNQLAYTNIQDWVEATGAEFTTNAGRAAKKRPEGNPGGDISYAQSSFNDSPWRLLNLPHDWGIEGPFKQEYPGQTGKLPWWGVAWYRKHLEIPVSDQGKKIYLAVDGAMAYATVWLNGQFVGGWPYGYASWQVDLTPYLKFGADNVIAIRLDNPTNSSRWYPGGGIYRNVWLVKTEPVHVAHWGACVTTPEVNPESATVKIQVQLDNDTDTDAAVTVKNEIFELDANGAKGKSVASLATDGVEIPALQSQTTAGQIILKNPRLWSIEKPQRYVVVTVLAQNGRSVDRYETPFGIRTIKFTADNGFLLNGKRVPLNGVCDHHDLGALGAAINTRALERQLQILKEMGGNAIRTSHNPPAPELLDWCDRLGLVVMDESFDCWKRGKTKNDYHLLFDDWHEKDWRAELRRDRNHPSIVIWSIGNEIGEQGNPAQHWIAAELTAIAHQEDPTRPTSAACNDPRTGFNGFQTNVDVFGYNYKPTQYGRVHDANPGLAVYGSETASCISSRGEYFFPVSTNQADGKADFQMSSYDLYAPRWATTPDAEFKGQNEFPYVAGEFVWTGFDYLGEPTPYNSDLSNLINYTDPAEKARAETELREIGKIRTPSRSSYFGIVDLAGFKKDRFYPLSGALASGSPHGAHPAALELARPRRPGHARPRLHLRRFGGTVPERQIARSEEKGTIRISPGMGRRGLSTGRTQGGRL